MTLSSFRMLSYGLVQRCDGLIQICILAHMVLVCIILDYIGIDKCSVVWPQMVKDKNLLCWSEENSCDGVIQL